MGHKIKRMGLHRDHICLWGSKPPQPLSLSIFQKMTPPQIYASLWNLDPEEPPAPLGQD